MNELETCPKCGSPIVGNESFCSTCGDRLGNASGPPGPSGARAILWIFGIVAGLAIAGAVGVYIVGRYVADTVHSRLGKSGDEAVGRVVASLHTAARENSRDRSFGCSLISESDASAITGIRVTRTESSRDSCTYFGVPDPNLNPDEDAIREMAGADADPQASRMIQQVTGAMRSSVEQQDPGARAGPGGERPLFTVQVNAAHSASMELAKNGGNAKAGGEAVPGLGDDAFFITMHRMFFVRKGTAYMLIQPQFVKDRRGVAIAAAQKSMDSPHFGR